MKTDAQGREKKTLLWRWSFLLQATADSLSDCGGLLALVVCFQIWIWGGESRMPRGVHSDVHIPSLGCSFRLSEAQKY